jgi:CelD/BcsL family acetyltransferase involved in cellulose biosynthesis
VYLDVVTDINRFRDMRDEWNRLLLTYESASLPLRHEWFFTWWQVFGADRQLNIVCIYDEERLIAIAPFLKEQSRYRGISIISQKLMANGHSPYCDLIIDCAISQKQKDGILDLVTRCDSVDVLLFNKIPEDSMIVHYLEKNAKHSGTCYGTKASLITPIIHIKGEWDDFIGSKSRKFRKSLNNKLNKFIKSRDFTITRESITSREHPYLKEMVEVSKQSWKRNLNNDLGSNIAGREFLFMLADIFGPGGNLNLWLMHKAGVPVAFEYHVVFKEVVYPFRADFSEEFRAFSPGSVLEYTALKSLFDEKNVKEYYSCADDYWYLNNWSKEFKKYINVEIFACTLKAKMLCALEYIFIPKLRFLRDMLSKTLNRGTTFGSDRD